MTAMQIGSMIIRVKPAFSDAVATAVAAMPGAEVRWVSTTKSKIVAVLESRRHSSLWQQLQNISAFEGVVATDWVYHINDTDGENKDG